MYARAFLRFNLLSVLLVAIFAIKAHAVVGVLEIQTRTSVRVESDLVKVDVVITNNGDGPAYNLQVHLNILGQEQDAPIKPRLDPGRSDTVIFEKSVPGVKKGRYPLTVYVDFHDANHYPFSALSGMTFHIDKDVNPDLVPLANDLIIAKSGKLRFEIKNLGLRSKKVQTSLVLPKELSSPRPKISLQLDPRSERAIDFEISNFSALPGASYPVFCYFEYDLEDTHHTAVAGAVIRIADEENWFQRTRWLWTALAGVLCVALVAVIIKERRKRTVP